ncbi:ALS2 C-terminal-like protein isoform X12 [Hippopotamus amphibius kiboko]|uniref:ALS2 C-terminal-like protein isoform X12 n=1 Tax=Hippopotamus amphibius kiboko TaxID=575201 RepID=UPI0025930C67|nr:ALS2 C-terminal-like protein isoform X12 [Hippopotamus amphibius kiboko]
MCSPEEVALLRLEEVFSATLARVNSLVLQPLLEAAPEPSDPWGRECLQQLHRSSQQLRKVTKESLHSLQERLRHPDSKGLESLLLLHSADCVLQVHLEYIEAYTSCVVVQAFQKAANRRSEYWRGQRKALRQLLAGMSSEGSVGTALVQALGQLLTHHVQQYVLLLLSLGDTVGEHHRTRELVVHAATIFVNLQSFMRQELDQAMATQALWHTLSSRLRDVLCTRTRRLLQDSQDMPMVVTPLRAERVLLFDDALVLLQGHNVHTFDLKLVWVEPGQDGCVFHLLTPEEDFSFCSKDPQGRGNPEVARWAESCGGFLPGPGARVQHQRGVQGLLPGGPAAWIWGPRERPTGPSALQVHGPLGEGPEEWLWRRGGQRQGPGILLSEDDSLYEGTFTRDLTLVGKGKVTFPNGFTLEGSFGSGAGRGLHTQGVLDTAALPPDPSSTCKRQLGLGVFPMESRWQGVYGPFWDFVRAGCPGDLQEALLGFHVQSSRELRKSQEHLCCERTHPEDHVGRMEDILEELLQHREPKALQQYLRKALSNSLHPLGKLLQTLMLTFQATYAGIGANKHLQGLAQEEVKQHAQELWAAYRGLLQVALQRKGQALEEDEDAETRDLQVHRLVLPLMLPSFYSELFTLYLLLHEREDSLYSQGIANLSLFPDTKLLEFLDVQKSLRSIDTARVEGMNTLSPPTPGPLCLKAPVALQGPHTDEQSEIFPRQRQVLPVSHRVSAEDDPSCCSTTVDPREKLEVLERTYGEIEATVSRVLGQEHKLPMDDLLPLLIYVVSRAQIQHLGAEIHLIRDMMDSTHTGGRYDFLLTALESCYEHIQKEDMGLHRLPSRWNSRELW